MKYLNNRTLLIGALVLFFGVAAFMILSPAAKKNVPPQPLPTQDETAPSPTQAAVKAPEYVPGQIMVKTKAGLPQHILDTQLKRNQAIIIQQIPEINLLVLQVPTGTEEQVVQNLTNGGVVQYAERNEIFQYNWVPNDPGLSQQYAIKKIQAEAAWDITKGTGIKVGLLDSGIQANHPDFAGRIAATKDFSGEGTLDDKVKHGTHTAGSITAATNNSLGIAGTCPECQLVFGKLGTTPQTNLIIQGITWAADNGAKVISMSLSTSSTCSQATQDAINYAWSKGAISVAAAGNESSNRSQSPASCQKVISVAATDSNDKMANFSNYGNWVTVAAPGVNIYSTYPGSTYKNLSGTSMATPITAAVVGLIWSTSYGTSPDAVSQRLCNTADKISGTGSNWKCGRINLLSAVKNATTSPVPSVAPTSAPPSIIVPTFGCMGSPNNICPTLPTTGSPAPGNPTTGPNPSASPSDIPGNPTNPSPSIQPCEENNIAYNRRGGKKKHVKRNQGAIGKFIQKLLEFFIRLIEAILGRGGNGNDLPADPGEPIEPC